MATTKLLVNIEANSAKLVTEMEKARKSISSVKDALQVIRFDSIINLGEKAISVGKQIYEFVEMGAKVKSVEDAFNLMAKNSGVAINSLISDLKRATNETIDDSDLMIKATRLIGEGFSSDQIASIGEASRTAARLMGTTVSEAYANLSDAIVNLRAKGLKTAGFVIDLEEAYDKHAKTLGVSKDALNDYGKQMAIVNAVKEKNLDLTGKLNIAQETEYEKLQQNAARWQEVKEGIGGMALEGWKELQSYISSTYSGIKDLFSLLDRAKGNTPTSGVNVYDMYKGPESGAGAEAKSQVSQAAMQKLAKEAEHTKNLIQNFGWEDWATGAYDATTKGTRAVNQMRLAYDSTADAIKKSLDLQKQLAAGQEEALGIAERLGVGTKAGMNQWVNKDIIGEYEKLLGSGLFSDAEMKQFAEKYTGALKDAMSGGWGDMPELNRLMESAIGKIQSMKVEDTGLGKTRQQLEEIQKTIAALDASSVKFNFDSDTITNASRQIDDLRNKLTSLVNQDWSVNIPIYGYGSERLPISEKISQIGGLFEGMFQGISNTSINIKIPTSSINVKDMMAEVSNAYQSMGPEVGKSILGLNQQDIANSIAGYEAELARVSSPMLQRYGVGVMSSGRYFEKQDQATAANATAQIEKLKGFQQMLEQTGSYANAQAVQAATPASGGGGGSYSDGGVTVNIGTIYVNGENAEVVAAGLDAQLADLYLRDRSKLKNAIKGSA
jgi:hypothetical protein